MRVRVRRRWITPRVILIVAVVAAVGVVVAIFVGRAHQASGTASTATPPDGPVTAPACQTSVHSVEGAVLAAVDGLHQLAQANLTPPAVDIEATLTRYVTAERRPLMRRYLETLPAPFTATTSTVLAWQSIAYTVDEARIRLATTDVATTATGETKTAQVVTDATLTFDPTQGFWRLADWKVNATPNVADVVTLGQQVPCHA